MNFDGESRIFENSPFSAVVCGHYYGRYDRYRFSPVCHVDVKDEEHEQEDITTMTAGR